MTEPQPQPGAQPPTRREKSIGEIAANIKAAREDLELIYEALVSNGVAPRFRALTAADEGLMIIEDMLEQLVATLQRKQEAETPGLKDANDNLRKQLEVARFKMRGKEEAEPEAEPEADTPAPDAEKA